MNCGRWSSSVFLEDMEFLKASVFSWQLKGQHRDKTLKALHQGTLTSPLHLFLPMLDPSSWEAEEEGLLSSRTAVNGTLNLLGEGG